MAKIIKLPVKRKCKQPPRPGQIEKHYVTKGAAAEKRPEISIVKEAEWNLRHRIRHVDSIRFLDGTPCDLDRLMKEANRVRHAWGLKKLGRKEEWLQ